MATFSELSFAVTIMHKISVIEGSSLVPRLSLLRKVAGRAWERG